MLINIQKMFKTYRMGENAVHALDGVSLTIGNGDFVAVMGASGSGKSTLLNILGCLDTPTSGTYLLDGVEVSRMSRAQLARIRNQKLGFVFQNFNLLSRTSALENVELPTFYNRRFPGRERRAHASRMLERVGLGNRADHTPAQLSGGQQQRVAIARALMNSPPVILADEPTGNLDSQSTRSILDLLHELHDEGVTILVITHDTSVAALAPHQITVADGRITADRR